jgi:hypothetical protein
MLGSSSDLNVSRETLSVMALFLSPWSIGALQNIKFQAPNSNEIPNFNIEAPCSPAEAGSPLCSDKLAGNLRNVRYLYHFIVVRSLTPPASGGLRGMRSLKHFQ